MSTADLLKKKSLHGNRWDIYEYFCIPFVLNLDHLAYGQSYLMSVEAVTAL